MSIDYDLQTRSVTKEHTFIFSNHSDLSDLSDHSDHSDLTDLNDLFKADQEEEQLFNWKFHFTEVTEVLKPFPAIDWGGGGTRTGEGIRRSLEEYKGEKP